MSAPGERKANHTRDRWRVPFIPISALTTPEARAVYVSQFFQAHAEADAERSKAVLVQLRKLRKDFKALRLTKPGERIMGCRTWTQFCTKVLKRSIRAIQSRLAGGNPRWKRRPKKPRGYKDGYVYQVVEVFFKNPDDVRCFATLNGLVVTPKTTYVWFAKREDDEEMDEGQSWG